jgi:hypothetical protein
VLRQVRNQCSRHFDDRLGHQVYTQRCTSLDEICRPCSSRAPNFTNGRVFWACQAQTDPGGRPLHQTLRLRIRRPADNHLGAQGAPNRLAVAGQLTAAAPPPADRALLVSHHHPRHRTKPGQVLPSAGEQILRPPRRPIPRTVVGLIRITEPSAGLGIGEKSAPGRCTAVREASTTRERRLPRCRQCPRRPAPTAAFGSGRCPNGPGVALAGTPTKRPASHSHPKARRSPPPACRHHPPLAAPASMNGPTITRGDTAPAAALPHAADTLSTARARAGGGSSGRSRERSSSGRRRAGIAVQ